MGKRLLWATAVGKGFLGGGRTWRILELQESMEPQPLAETHTQRDSAGKHFGLEVCSASG